MSARPAALALPSLVRASIAGGVRIATSNAAPLSISVLSSEAAPKVITSLCLAAFSNSGARTSSEVFTALDTSIRISAALAQPAPTHATIEIPPATATATALMLASRFAVRPALAPGNFTGKPPLWRGTPWAAAAGGPKG